MEQGIKYAVIILSIILLSQIYALSTILLSPILLNIFARFGDIVSSWAGFSLLMKIIQIFLNTAVIVVLLRYINRKNKRFSLIFSHILLASFAITFLLRVVDTISLIVSSIEFSFLIFILGIYTCLASVWNTDMAMENIH
jgi:hypothetical protein